MIACCAVPLPADFRPSDLYAFHRRDPQSPAEEVDEACGRVAKGLVWQGRPARLTLHFLPGRVEAELKVDGPDYRADPAALQTSLRRMLGLDQDISGFEQAYRGHPRLGPLITRNPGLRVPLAATPFEALTWAVTGQQVSVHAAVALRRRLILAAGVRHSSGLACYPDAAAVAGLGLEPLRRAGYSQSKAQTLLEVSRLVLDGTLPLEEWLAGALPPEAIGARLLAVRGIGPWTANYALLRGFGWLDGSLHGDAGVRQGIQTLLGTPDDIDAETARLWLAPFSPWRALVAAHLWALNAAQGARR